MNTINLIIMRQASFYLVILVILLAGCKKSKLIINGKPDYQIVISNKANSIEKRAAKQLQHYFMKMSKAKLPIVKESKYRGNKAIYIGHTNYAEALDFDCGQLEGDGYAFKPQNQNFVITGGSEKGVLYGVYDLLEFLDFRKYTSDCTHIPKRDSIILPQKDTVVVPRIKFRELYYNDAYKPSFSNWHKLDAHSETWGSWVHTFNNLVPPEKYSETHPEYYAFWNGERHTGLGSQLCLSNPEVVDILINNLTKEMAKKPNIKYWSVSQNDNHNYCRCDACKKLYEQYGGPSGATIHFVNKVAREFPNKIISTLAYEYSRSAPENIEPEHNVNIMLCTIESERHKSIPQTDTAFASDLEEWGKLTDNILVWDYNIQFRNLVSPFPNLHTIRPNINFFTENNVNALFMQANREVGGEMAELRAYLIAKLLWDPDANDQAIIEDFLNGYYGDAGPYILQYIDTMRHTLLENDYHLKIFGSPEEAKNTYLSVEMMDEYKRLFDEAEKAVEEDPELLRRVQIARLPIMYAQIQIGCTEMDTPRSLYKHNTSGKVVAKPEMITMVHQFVERCNEQGVTRLKEWSTNPDEYLESYSRIFDKMNKMDDAISLNKKIILVTSPSNKYEGLQALSNGVFGSYNKDFNWVGYEGEHMDFIVDLGKVMPVKSVTIDFLNGLNQWDPVFLPEYLTYKTSVDGENYSDSVKVINPNKPDKNPNKSNKKRIYVQTFQSDMNNCKTRYIKVHAESLLSCPSWHMHVGDSAWLFADEIVIK